MRPCYIPSASAVLVFATTVVSQPQIVFPIKAQLPPVAVVEQPFEFVFAPGTFTSTNIISYALQEAPSWLQLDNTTRTLSGIPSAEEIGTASIVLKASDLKGDITDKIGLIVIDHNSLSLNEALMTKRLLGAGELSDVEHLILHPQSPFSLQLGPDLFEGADASTQYFASSSDHSPLPAWVNFDNKAVAFTGITPSLLTPQSSPQLFSFVLAASSIAGFTEAAANFQISIANHILAFSAPSQSFNVSGGESLEVPSLSNTLQRDGKPIDPSVIQSSSATQPAWLIFESSNLSFSGTVPDSFTGTDFDLSVTDDLNNIANLHVRLQDRENENLNDTSHPVSNVDLGTVYATTGTFFQYTYKSIYKIVRTDQVTVELDQTPWLDFLRSNLTVQGFVPEDVDGTNFDLDFVLSRDNQDLEDAHVTVVAVKDSSAASNNGPPVTSDPATPNDRSPSEEESTRKRKLILLITLPVLAALLIGILASVLVIKVSKRERRDTHRRPASTTIGMAEVQRLYHDSSLGSSLSENYAILAGTPNSSRAMLHEIESSPRPRIELPWSSQKQSTNKIFSDRNTRMPTTRTSWDDMLMEMDSPFRDKVSPRRHAANKDSTENVPLPPSHSLAKPQILRAGTKFNGRRRSRLSHGSSLGSPSSDRLPKTLRQVPVSPIDEDHSTDDFRGIGGCHFASMDDIAMLDDSRLARNHVKTSSSLSSNSRYAPAKSEHELKSQRTSGSEWEDDDWRTQSSDQKSSLWHARLPRNRPSAEGTLSSKEAAVVGLGSSYIGGLTTTSSRGRSLCQRSEQSHSNSLRFI